MKANPEFISREIAGELVLVPIGSAAASCGGLITCNEVGAFIWNRIKDGCDMETLTAAITSEFETDDSTAAADAEEFIGRLRSLGAIID